MQRTIAYLAAIPFLTFAVIGCGDVGDAAEAETGEEVEVRESSGTEYEIDTAASSIDWVGAKVTRSHDGGFSVFSGNAIVNDGRLDKITVNVETSSIWSDTEKLTGHLKSPDFFHVDSIPSATFEASNFESISDTGDVTHRVTGNLTLLGVTRSISFPAAVDISDDAVEFTADFIIDRQKWGMSYPGMPDDLISDEVRLKIDATARKKS